MKRNNDGLKTDKKRYRKPKSLVQWQDDGHGHYKELPCRPSSDGSSPYWDYVENLGRGDDDELRENRFANPDVLPDPESDLWHIPNFSNATERQEFVDEYSPKVQKAMLKLTKN